MKLRHIDCHLCHENNDEYQEANNVFFCGKRAENNSYTHKAFELYQGLFGSNNLFLVLNLE